MDQVKHIVTVHVTLAIGFKSQQCIFPSPQISWPRKLQFLKMVGPSLCAVFGPPPQKNIFFGGMPKIEHPKYTVAGKCPFLTCFPPANLPCLSLKKNCIEYTRGSLSLGDCVAVILGLSITSLFLFVKEH